MSYDATKINCPEKWVFQRIYKQYLWLWNAEPGMRQDLRSEYDLAKLLAVMYPNPIDAYNESKRRIYALAVQEGYHWTGMKWEGSNRRDMNQLTKHIVYGNCPARKKAA
jgi:hypothetical protein